MASVACPACSTAFTVSDPLMIPGHAVRCPECGTKMRLERRPAPAGDDKVLFPNAKADETLLDLSDAVKAVRKGAKPKKRKK